VDTSQHQGRGSAPLPAAACGLWRTSVESSRRAVDVMSTLLLEVEFGHCSLVPTPHPPPPPPHYARVAHRGCLHGDAFGVRFSFLELFFSLRSFLDDLGVFGLCGVVSPSTPAPSPRERPRRQTHGHGSVVCITPNQNPGTGHQLPLLIQRFPFLMAPYPDASASAPWCLTPSLCCSVSSGSTSLGVHRWALRHPCSGGPAPASPCSASSADATAVSCAVLSGSSLCPCTWVAGKQLGLRVWPP
jgi:hypothetical protein